MAAAPSKKRPSQQAKYRSSLSSAAAGVRNDVADIGAAARVQPPPPAAAAATATIDINNTIDLSAATVIVASQIASSPPSASPPQVETILCRNVDCYVSGLLASFKRTTLNKMVHEVLILYPRSEYAIEMERPIIHQRRGGKGSKAK